MPEKKIPVYDNNGHLIAVRQGNTVAYYNGNQYTKGTPFSNLYISPYGYELFYDENGGVSSTPGFNPQTGQPYQKSARVYSVEQAFALGKAVTFANVAKERAEQARQAGNQEEMQQWMKAQQANEDLQKQILEHKTNNAADFRRFGRQVKGYDDEIWNQMGPGWMAQAMMAKASSDPVFHDALVKTAGMDLVEAAPRDGKWGGQIDINQTPDFSQYQGQNIQGALLKSVRKQIVGNEMYRQQVLQDVNKRMNAFNDRLSQRQQVQAKVEQQQETAGAQQDQHSNSITFEEAVRQLAVQVDDLSKNARTPAQKQASAKLKQAINAYGDAQQPGGDQGNNLDHDDDFANRQVPKEAEKQKQADETNYRNNVAALGGQSNAPQTSDPQQSSQPDNENNGVGFGDDMFGDTSEAPVENKEAEKSSPVKVVAMPNNDGRYMVVDSKTGKTVDDAQGYGYKSPDKAQTAWDYSHGDKKNSMESKKPKNLKVTEMPNKEGRYVVVNADNGQLVDDARGYGYKSVEKAQNAWGIIPDEPQSSAPESTQPASEQPAKTQAERGAEAAALGFTEDLFGASDVEPPKTKDIPRKQPGHQGNKQQAPVANDGLDQAEQELPPEEDEVDNQPPIGFGEDVFQPAPQAPTNPAPQPTNVQKKPAQQAQSSATQEQTKTKATPSFNHPGANYTMTAFGHSPRDIYSTLSRQDNDDVVSALQASDPSLSAEAAKAKVSQMSSKDRAEAMPKDQQLGLTANYSRQYAGENTKDRFSVAEQLKFEAMIEKRLKQYGHVDLQCSFGPGTPTAFTRAALAVKQHHPKSVKVYGNFAGPAEFASRNSDMGRQGGGPLKNGLTPSQNAMMEAKLMLNSMDGVNFYTWSKDKDGNVQPKSTFIDRDTFRKDYLHGDPSKFNQDAIKAIKEAEAGNPYQIPRRVYWKMAHDRIDRSHESIAVYDGQYEKQNARGEARTKKDGKQIYSNTGRLAKYAQVDPKDYSYKDTKPEMSGVIPSDSTRKIEPVNGKIAHTRRIKDPETGEYKEGNPVTQAKLTTVMPSEIAGMVVNAQNDPSLKHGIYSINDVDGEKVDLNLKTDPMPSKGGSKYRNKVLASFKQPYDPSKFYMKNGNSHYKRNKAPKNSNNSANYSAGNDSNRVDFGYGVFPTDTPGDPKVEQQLKGFKDSGKVQTKQQRAYLQQQSDQAKQATFSQNRQQLAQDANQPAQEKSTKSAEDGLIK